MKWVDHRMGRRRRIRSFEMWPRDGSHGPLEDHGGGHVGPLRTPGPTRRPRVGVDVRLPWWALALPALAFAALLAADR